jgi:RNA polymerase sigma-70 factor, ECF subfamily
VASDLTFELRARLAAACETARAAYPDLDLDPDVLVAAIVRGGGEDLAEHLERCHVADLAIATAARDGVAGAIERLEHRHRETIEALCHRFAQPGYSFDDLFQVLRTKLFVADGETPARIGDYNGRGSLSNWLRVIATREFIDLGRRKDRPRERAASEGELEQLLAPADIQLDAIKAEYRTAILAAMQEAVRELDGGDRHLLRQHLIVGLTFDQLTAVLGVHRATVARRIARARERIVRRTRELAGERLGLGEDELAEIYELVRSKLELSFQTLLATPRPS